jgi:nitric oxide synthase oxygenase domain/subunit
LNWTQIQLKKNGIQTDKENFQNLLMNMVLERNLKKKHKYEKIPFHAFHLEMDKTNSNLELWRWQLMELKVVILKPISMNHHQCNCFSIMFSKKNKK